MVSSVTLNRHAIACDRELFDCERLPTQRWSECNTLAILARKAWSHWICIRSKSAAFETNCRLSSVDIVDQLDSGRTDLRFHCSNAVTVNWMLSLSLWTKCATICGYRICSDIWMHYIISAPTVSPPAPSPTTMATRTRILILCVVRRQNRMLLVYLQMGFCIIPRRRRRLIVSPHRCTPHAIPNTHTRTHTIEPWCHEFIRRTNEILYILYAICVHKCLRAKRA